MPLKVSNELKVGALTAISITLLILGFNFLKGNNPLKKSQYFFAKFNSIEGLVPSNPVLMNGLSVGTVYKTEPADQTLSSVLVTIRLTENVVIPSDSRAVIKGNLLSTPAVEIIKGSASTYLKKGDTLTTEESSGFLGSVLEQLGPTQQSLNVALQQLDTMLVGVNRVLDDKAQADLRQTIHNLNVVSTQLTRSTAALNELLSQQKGAVATTIKNMETFSGQLRQSGQQLPAISANLDKTTKQLSELELDKTLRSIDQTLGEMRSLLAKAGDQQGTLGALMNDRRLYNNLTSTVNSLNLLMQDLRLHPKRYVNVSVFGRRDRSEPLMRPMDEDSLTQEQIKRQ